MPATRRAFARLSLLLSAMALAAPAWAQVSVDDAWARATVPQQKSSGAYLRITAARAAALVEVRTPVAGSAEIHEMSMVGDVMRMRAIDRLPLPAGRAVALEPGGYHVMLLDLKRQLKAGEVVPLTLVIEDQDKKRQSVEVQASVRPASGNAPAKPDHAH
ncbi:MAG: copper chaperone PCu(A)C [Aquabacterium sp.]|nr:MAG: copper chaperone PCu(A)C [Aquabacterium sp.]